MHVFWQKGYEATKVPDLLAATGLSRSSLYETFGDKQALFEASIKEYNRSITGVRLVQLQRGRTAKEGLTLFFDHLIATCLDESTPSGCLMVNTTTTLDPHDQRIKEIVNESGKGFHEAFLALLERAKADGEISSSQNLQDLVHMLVAIIVGINVMARTTMDAATLQTMADSTINVVFS
ncbi:TetR/AcrR family transcriptional regulator [Desulfuromusa kysingii]|nr:TetR/AcrR family transcriptional regulator [Desulfuromusa kysingii]